MEEISTFNFDQASWEDLRTEAKRLQSELDIANNKMRYLETAFANRERQVSRTSDIITEMISEDVITDEDYIKALVETLNLEILRTANFTITVEITGTVELPLGTELDEYAFDVDSLSYNGDNVDFSQESVIIDGWEFDEQ